MQLKINGTETEVPVAEDTPLLWALRDGLGLTGTKYGCDSGTCGTCAVHVDGVLTRACQISLGELRRRGVTTIEGLAGAEALHPLQQAFIELGAVHCGYCQSGQLMAAAALLAQTPEPSDAEIDAAMAAQLCRCGMYPRIRAAIHRAAALMAESAR